MSFDNEYGISLEELGPDDPKLCPECKHELFSEIVGYSCLNAECNWIDGPDDEELPEAA